jgi:fumarylpyruvate hydrolase
MNFVFNPPATVSVPVLGSSARFPVHRIYCVGRNYEEHAKEMGFTGREPPFFFLKPADALVVVNAGETGTMPYPSLTQNLHHEIELVVAIGTGGRNIKAADAYQHIFGFAVGLDMTRRDLQNDMKKQGRPGASARRSTSPRRSARSPRRRWPATCTTPRSPCRSTAPTASAATCPS